MDSKHKNELIRLKYKKLLDKRKKYTELSKWIKHLLTFFNQKHLLVSKKHHLHKIIR